MSNPIGLNAGAAGKPRTVHKQRRAELTRENIISSAAKVFDSIGYAATSVNEIISVSNSTKGALYFHFPAKSDIARQLVEGWESAVLSLEQRAANTDATPLGRLAMISRAHAELVATNTQHRAGLRLSTEPELDAAAGIYTEWERRLEMLIKEAVEAGEVRDTATTRRFASLYCATLIGLVHAAAARRIDKAPFETQVEDLLSGWLVGILTDASRLNGLGFLTHRLPSESETVAI